MDNGNKSSMRLFCFLSLLASFFFGFMAIRLPDNANAIYVYLGFLVGAFAPKAVQKFAEQKMGK